LTHHEEEIQALMEKAARSLEAATYLAEEGFYEFAISRAYYAAFYAASALLLTEGLVFRRHSGVIAAIHQHFVKTQRLPREQGQALSWLFEARNVGDYGGWATIGAADATRGIELARDFVNAVQTLLAP